MATQLFGDGTGRGLVPTTLVMAFVAWRSMADAGWFPFVATLGMVLLLMAALQCMLSPVAKSNYLVQQAEGSFR